MTRGQKIAVIVSAITISVVVGGLLYLYFNRKSVLKKLQEGESVTYKLKEPKKDTHESSEYELDIKPSTKSESGNAIFLRQDGELKGKYWIKDDVVTYVHSKETEFDEVTDKKEEKFIRYLLENAEI